MHRRCKQGEQAYECSLFHGTRSEYVGSICKQNFDFRSSGGQHGSAFGKTDSCIYAAITSASFDMSVPFRTRQLLYGFRQSILIFGKGRRRQQTRFRVQGTVLSHSICSNVASSVTQVLVGDYTKGNPTLRRPPSKFSTSSCYEMYDSVCDKVKEPSVFVVFDNDQVYPDYIITYR